ncbi:hypothetical protein KNP414_05564 [Paenibacillus mucilaginosus KNP414]|uniref:Uncharacterized protein n=1 Tax=Paenibacillus mucilaginosus (strain KNP414) TaxID=1036673 RepID=F8FK47_PAEMK|nr:hypothetical protein KNP414_05564 [Paenibacillus mucilaginosus KNP414]
MQRGCLPHYPIRGLSNQISTKAERVPGSLNVDRMNAGGGACFFSAHLQLPFMFTS